MMFVKEFNAKTADLPLGSPTPVVITYYQDKSFSLEFKTTPAAYLLKQAAGLPQVGKRNRAKGSVKPGHTVAGTVTVAQIRKIAETKMKDLSANSIEAAMKIIMGSAKSCGIEIKG
jgi:large subunit ribosomal protein L11